MAGIRRLVAVLCTQAVALLAVLASQIGMTWAGGLLAALEPLRQGERLAFAIDDGDLRHVLIRQGPVAAHLVARGGRRGRLLVAFSAGDSGTGLWLRAKEPLVWTGITPLRAVRWRPAGERVLHGVTVDLAAQASGMITIEQAVLGSLRTLRAYQNGDPLPQAVRTSWRWDGKGVLWHRRRADGKAGYLLALIPLRGALIADGRRLRLRPVDGRFVLRLVALTGETPLTPIPQARILRTGERQADPALLRALTFLSYREKLLAGSWRFLTYFGRDTLLSLYLLMPVVSADVAEAGLAAVIARLSEQGAVAHEEEIGEFAVLRHHAQDGRTDDTPIYDYKMIDDDFLFTPVLLRYLRMVSSRRSAAFLTRRTARGETVADAVRRQMAFVLKRARPFAARPTTARLIALKPGQTVGNWRDSPTGLGGGRYPYDVNAVFVPLALEAVAAILAGGWLPPQPHDPQLAAEARRLAAVWEKRAPPLFAVSLPGAQACAAIQGFAEKLRVPSAGCGGRREPVRIAALALDGKGEPIPVLHSDTGFRLLFRDPPETELMAILDSVLQPFPAGLLTPVGMLVANPVYAGLRQQEMLTRRHYHGMVVWSWQQAVMAAGLARQFERKDISPATRAKLAAARQAVWTAIAAAQSRQAAELWSWDFRRGRYRVVPFHPARGHASEANAVQLWSTVFLALTPPADGMPTPLRIQSP